MQNLTVDTGVEEYCINGRGVLRFNPADPNLYHRFFAAAPGLDALDTELDGKMRSLPQEDEAARAEAGLALLAEYDAKLKGMLTEIFGAENDFANLLEGVNLAGIAANGRRVVQNLLDALTPVLQAGAERRLCEQAEQAAAAAAENRAERAAL